ncbi:hypothetical protein SIID45300_00834 [Candidatus Magnetaquicoccaceae bacterium FCR-1]|uniref:Secretin/TonB short N-terminal domain-containing protein n=1 Tax=Candidatus Magnetaquiglobus chichijimensis TaxID=3141448 RepID=A0ABQ0C6M0_9PROT
MNVFRFILLLFLLHGVPASLNAAPAASSDSSRRADSSVAGESVVYRNHKLSVNLRAVPIREALQKVSDQVGLSFLVDPEVSGKVSAQFENLSLEKGLRRLLSGQSHAMVHAVPQKGGKGDKSAQRITQVKVFKKGSLNLTRYDTIHPSEPSEPVVEKKGGDEKNAVKSVDKGSAPSQGAVQGSSGAETAKTGGREVDSSRHPSPARVDTHGVRGPAQVMAAIQETESAIALIHRKAQGERQAIEYESARTRETLASGQGNPKDLVDKLTTLEQQKARSEQNTQAMLAPEQQKLQQLRQDLESLKTPAEQQIENRAMVNRQAAVMRDQAGQVEDARRVEASRQAAMVAEQRANAARETEARRQAEIRRQQELSNRNAGP